MASTGSSTPAGDTTAVPAITVGGTTTVSAATIAGGETAAAAARNATSLFLWRPRKGLCVCLPSASAGGLALHTPLCAWLVLVLAMVAAVGVRRGVAEVGPANSSHPHASARSPSGHTRRIAGGTTRPSPTSPDGWWPKLLPPLPATGLLGGLPVAAACTVLLVAVAVVDTDGLGKGWALRTAIRSDRWLRWNGNCVGGWERFCRSQRFTFQLNELNGKYLGKLSIFRAVAAAIGRRNLV